MHDGVMLDHEVVIRSVGFSQCRTGTDHFAVASLLVNGIEVNLCAMIA